MPNPRPLLSWLPPHAPALSLSLRHPSPPLAGMTRGSPHVWLGVLAAAVLAAPALKHAWLVALNSNANVLFNMALAVTVAGGSLLAEFAAASLRAQKVEARLAAWADSRLAKGASAAAEAGVAAAVKG